MHLITITFLVRAIEKPNDCSVVRENSTDPMLTNGRKT
jgi:hypothetical protein